MKVKDVFSRGTITVPSGATLRAVALTMRTERTGSALVVGADDVPVGIITRENVVEAVAVGADPDHATAELWMSAAPLITVELEDDGREAAARMRDFDVQHLPVIERGTVVGMLSARDLLQGLTAPLPGA